MTTPKELVQATAEGPEEAVLAQPGTELVEDRGNDTFVVLVPATPFVLAALEVYGCASWLSDDGSVEYWAEEQ